MRFAEVVGHNDLKQKLIDTVKQERVSHSQFFYGPEGNGAFALAEAYAQYLLCDNPSYHDSCGQCTPCKQILHFNYPDLHYVYPVAKVNTKSSDKPVSGDYMPAWKSLLAERKILWHFSLAGIFGYRK
ncbi:MAG: hypothetical protein U5L96_01870 [Owenweeksia sp.]|nr:hypothetical protein [Owenweeksia sp.]